ncbi:unnamed protein product [Darwinula stevensoni]|uniref:Uncharacterized protein n=1 Tax=Darwinula stevensoni TaxID=69355 RepID=A0A7R8XDD5_9CRUS|nr:unnamed protein product [Darwinula stevensoni]CAG0888530.1 unnamed protein product [Darwinula stevensoni]
MCVSSMRWLQSLRSEKGDHGWYYPGVGGPRENPLTHPAVDAPLCEDCQGLQLTFFDPSCPGCRALLKSPATTIAHVFAILRQWVPQTQQNIQTLVDEVLRRGGHVDDRDSLTDMTLLQYACKAGASGVGDVTLATKVVGMLLSKGAEVSIRCRWTHMTALHYAAYFDVAPVLRLLLKASKGVDVDWRCGEYENGTALHITAGNLCLEAAKVLLEHGADLTATDDLGRTPLECVPEASTFDLIPDVQEVIGKMRRLLSPDCNGRNGHGTLTKQSFESISGRAVLQAMGLKVGDKVVVGGNKTGTLRYCGTTEFSTGIWAGVELDTAEGRNDGSVKGVMYFRCKPNHGLFAPLNRIARLGSPGSGSGTGFSRTASLRRSSRSLSKVNHPRIDTSKVTSKVASSTRKGDKEGIRVGDPVVVIGAGRRKGVVRFSGTVQFASGWWYGVELDRPEGRNDGSVQGIPYFSCPPNHGVFAPLARLAKLGGDGEEEEEEEESEFDSLDQGSMCTMSGRSSLIDSSSMSTNPYATLRRTSSMRHHKSAYRPPPPPSTTSTYASTYASTSTSTFSRSYSVRYPSSRNSGGGVQPPWQSVPLEPEKPRRRKDKDHWLSLGMNVLFNHEVGVIRWLGRVDFADGIWLGLELRGRKGKHDGAVDGKRYFTCKPGHGIFVRPSNVTVRGINGAKLRGNGGTDIAGCHEKTRDATQSKGEDRNGTDGEGTLVTSSGRLRNLNNRLVIAKQLRLDRNRSHVELRSDDRNGASDNPEPQLNSVMVDINARTGGISHATQNQPNLVLIHWLQVRFKCGSDIMPSRKNKKIPKYNVQPTAEELKEAEEAVKVKYSDSQKVFIELDIDGERASIDLEEGIPLVKKEEFVSPLNDLVDGETKSTREKPLSDASRAKGKSSAKRSKSKTPSKSKSKKSVKTDENSKAGCSPDSKKGEELQPKASVLPEALVKLIDDYDIEDAPARPISYYRFIEKLADELDEEVEYDMDEEDCAWLQLMNSRREAEAAPPVTMENFELLMDRLEKESYFQMQFSGKEHGVPIDDDAICCICMDGECENTNVILFCDMCNLAVHQECYGVPYIPEGQWLCRRCLQSPSRGVDCALCPNSGGAFKQTTDGRWAHVVCAIWIPEVHFSNTVFLEPIDNIQNIPAARWRLTCYICRRRGVGACIQCQKSNCYTAFHVTCAQQAGLHMKIDAAREHVGNVLVPSVKKSAYCDAHTPQDSDCKPQVNTVKREEKKHKGKRSGAPMVISIPTLPPERIQQIASVVTFSKKSQFMQRLMAYWMLKRQSRNGVPLLRRLQSMHPSRNSRLLEGIPDEKTQAMFKQLREWQQLRQDLERARLLCELVRKREKTKRELMAVRERELTLRLTPLNCILHQVLDALQERDTQEIFAEPVDTEEVTDYLDVITHPMDFSTMRKKVDNCQYARVEDFESDFSLMIRNCLTYNSKDTVFYKAGVRMRDLGGGILRQANRDLEASGFDPGTGLVREETGVNREDDDDDDDCDVIAILYGEDRKQLPLRRQLDLLLEAKDRISWIPHAATRAKRMKAVKLEIVKVRRKLALETASDSDNEVGEVKEPKTCEDAEDVTPRKSKRSRAPSKVETNGPENTKQDEGKNPANKEESVEDGDDEEDGEVQKTGPRRRQSSGRGKRKREEKESEIEKEKDRPLAGVNRRTAVLFAKKASALNANSHNNSNGGTNHDVPPPAEPEPKPKSPEKRGKKALFMEVLKELDCNNDRTLDPVEVALPSVTDKESFLHYRNAGTVSDDEDVRSEIGSCSSCSTYSSSCENSEADSQTDSDAYASDSENKRKPVEPLDMVWAKCRGYPWYPALIINPSMPRTGYYHNGVPIPVPPEDVLALSKTHEEPRFLVLFFDNKRTWQWLPRTKLEPLGEDPAVDKAKLKESKKASERKAVRKAYERAVVHHYQVTTGSSMEIPLDSQSEGIGRS